MRLILSLIFSLICLSTLAETSLWKVSNGDKHIYLGGTFHMLAESDYPLPAEFEDTYQKVNWLVFETDISALESAEFQQQFQQAFLLPAGEHSKPPYRTQRFSNSVITASKIRSTCALLCPLNHNLSA